MANYDQDTGTTEHHLLLLGSGFFIAVIYRQIVSVIIDLRIVGNSSSKIS